MKVSERRKFIRHPVEIPIRISPQVEELTPTPVSDVGEGGLAFSSSVAFADGAQLKITIPHLRPPFEASCIVCWQRMKGDRFEVGVKFLDENTVFRARMVEQLCHIENYRKQAGKKGRELSSEESACEWIDNYAADFGVMSSDE